MCIVYALETKTKSTEVYEYLFAMGKEISNNASKFTAGAGEQNYIQKHAMIPYNFPSWRSFS